MTTSELALVLHDAFLVFCERVLSRRRQHHHHAPACAADLALPHSSPAQHVPPGLRGHSCLLYSSETKGEGVERDRESEAVGWAEATPDQALSTPSVFMAREVAWKKGRKKKTVLNER